MHLTKVGRFSQEELVDFFKKFDSWYAYLYEIVHVETFLNLQQSDFGILCVSGNLIHPQLRN